MTLTQFYSTWRTRAAKPSEITVCLVKIWSSSITPLMMMWSSSIFSNFWSKRSWLPHSSHFWVYSSSLHLYPPPALHLHHPSSCATLYSLQGSVVFWKLKIGFGYTSAFSYCPLSLGWGPRALHLYSSLSFSTCCSFFSWKMTLFPLPALTSVIFI